jgi:excisionase family DNA binding protein
LPPAEPIEPEEPWLTVAEVAEELRVNPATVRLWISRGALPATRAGLRKLLIRRSDLERMLQARHGEPAPARPTFTRPAPDRSQADSPHRSFRQLSEGEPTHTDVSPEEIGRALEDIQVSDDAWAQAQYASDHAPPDPGFPFRVRALADAASEQARVLTAASRFPRLRWTPTGKTREVTVSHELRPGAQRPGPADLWADFDRSVERLGIAMDGHDLATVGARWTDLAEVMDAIADTLLDDTRSRRGRQG